MRPKAREKEAAPSGAVAPLGLDYEWPEKVWWWVYNGKCSIPIVPHGFRYFNEFTETLVCFRECPPNPSRFVAMQSGSFVEACAAGRALAAKRVVLIRGESLEDDCILAEFHLD